eukprot:Seg904.7 transcript_id=Seg904.7/GoldUCD/mRNA.D3Y31 product="Heparan sulfate glucosamine 3-O-sulfotransferase 4" protein_id=Seg904.7/GoldUCD/D3Y31
MAAAKDITRRDIAKFILTCFAFMFLISYLLRGKFLLAQQGGTSTKQGIAYLCLTKACFEKHAARMELKLRAGAQLPHDEMDRTKLGFKASRHLQSKVANNDNLIAQNYVTQSEQRATSKSDENLKFNEISDSRKGGGKNLLQRLPNALIIGVKKGGTKALLVFLRVHPDIQACNKEVHFFDKNYQKGIQWYKRRMPRSYPNEITLEKSPRYFVDQHVPKRVYEMSPSIKLLIILRDPVKRAISDYAHMKTRKKKYLMKKDIEEILWNNKTGKFNSSAQFLRNGLYAVFLKRWLRYFPREQIHIVNGDEFIKRPGSEVMKVQKFLNLDMQIDETDFVYNKTKQFYCIKNKFIDRRTTRHKDSICLGKSKGRKHPYVSQKTLQAIREFYRPHNEELYKLVGINFGW